MESWGPAEQRRSPRAYALYKQGTEGDNLGKRPGMLDLKGRAKFDVWASKKGLGRDAAMPAYVTLVDRLLKG